jgi:hypothetical protein
MSAIATEADRQRINREADLAERSRYQDAPAQGSLTLIGTTTTGVKNDQQNLLIRGKPTGGTWLLKGLTSGAVPFATSLPWNATFTQVQTALRAIFGAGEVFCFGTNILGVGGGVNRALVVQFGTNGSTDGTLIYTPIAAMTADLTGLTGGSRYEFRIFHAAVAEPRYPTAPNRVFRITAGGAFAYAANLGSLLPPLGTRVQCRLVQDGYAFNYG